MIGFEDVLQGTALRSTVRAIEPTVCFRIAADDFMTMVSDNVLVAQSLFASCSPTIVRVSPLRSRRARWRTESPGAVHAARLLRHDPLLSRASATQLLALTAVAPEVPLKAGSVLFDVGTPPAVYQIVQGEVVLEHPGTSPAVAPAGATIGVADTLAGTTSGWQATVSKDGRALRLERDELFSVLADHVDLMQGLFSGVLALRIRRRKRLSCRRIHSSSDTERGHSWTSVSAPESWARSCLSGSLPHFSRGSTCACTEFCAVARGDGGVPLKARVSNMRDAGSGVTNSRRATLKRRSVDA